MPGKCKGKKGAAPALPVHTNGPFPTVVEISFDEDASSLEFKYTVEVGYILDRNLVDITDNESSAESSLLPFALGYVCDPYSTFESHFVKLVDIDILKGGAFERVGDLPRLRYRCSRIAAKT